MRLKKWSDEELYSIRDEIDAWCEKYHKSVWGGRKGYVIALFGTFAISTGFVYLFFAEPEIVTFLPIVLGVTVCLTWYKAKKQFDKNHAFLEEARAEIARREKKARKNKKKKGEVEQNHNAAEKQQEEVDISPEAEPDTKAQAQAISTPSSTSESGKVDH